MRTSWKETSTSWKLEENKARLLLMPDDASDWERVGRAVSKNTMLKQLYFINLEGDAEDYGVFRGVLQNKSLESINLNNCDISFCIDFFSMFVTGRKKNRRGLEKLRYLGLDECDTSPALLSAIARCLMTFLRNSSCNPTSRTAKH